MSPNPAELHVHVPNSANPTIPKYIITLIDQNTFNPNPSKKCLPLFVLDVFCWPTLIASTRANRSSHLPTDFTLSIGGVDPGVGFGCNLKTMALEQKMSFTGINGISLRVWKLNTVKHCNCKALVIEVHWLFSIPNGTYDSLCGIKHSLVLRCMQQNNPVMMVL